jgi:hypothetical protein
LVAERTAAPCSAGEDHCSEGCAVSLPLLRPPATTERVEELAPRLPGGFALVFVDPPYASGPEAGLTLAGGLLAPGGRIRWTPAAGGPGVRPAFSVKVWDGWRMSGVSQVAVNLAR